MPVISLRVQRGVVALILARYTAEEGDAHKVPARKGWFEGYENRLSTATNNQEHAAVHDPGWGNCAVR